MNAFVKQEIKAIGLEAGLDPTLLPPAELLDVIFGRRFGVEYQPLVSVQSGQVIGYQATARFWTNTNRLLHTGKMFRCLHRNPLLLFHAEYELKKLQIEKCPATGMLILDLDIDSFLEGGKDQGNPFLKLFKEHIWAEREDLIINIVENADTADALQSQRMVEMLQEAGISVAMEDIGVRWGMFSIGAFIDARVIRFNGLAMQALDQAAARAALEWMLEAAKRIGVQTILGGIDTPAQLDWARGLGVDCLQGPIFNKRNVLIKP